MPHIRQQGILSATSDSVTDADVIMTAAIVGHSYERLSAGKNCRYDVEAGDIEKDMKPHEDAMRRINKALPNGGLKNKIVSVGVTPTYAPDKNTVRIVGGTGNLALDERYRYEPELPSGLSKTLYDLVMGSDGDKLGYQGRGAYTGFIAGRKDGQTGLMSTYRFKVLPENERRWIPSKIDSDLGSQIGNNDDERRAWGMIGSNKTQQEMKKQGMYMEDEKKGEQGQAAQPAGSEDIVGYVHGMIQAIYDVVWRKGGTPYEIAVGKNTVKLASCFPCAIFMEATGYPASSTHLGRGESWCVLHSKGTTSQDTARQECNDKWAEYCKKIITRGIACMQKKGADPIVNENHQASYDALCKYIKDFATPSNKYLYANLILDAVTVHKSEYKRVNDTLTL